MTTPTPEEITAALDVLHRIPGVDPRHSLEAVAEIASPVVQMAQEVHNFLGEEGLPLAYQIEDIAARHGLRITTDAEPGELVGYEELARYGGEWCSIGRTYPATGMELPVPNEGNRIAALYLRPEGGQA